MVLPFMGMLLALIFFFGWALRNQQHVKVSDRYWSWRRVRAGGAASASELNGKFFGRTASGVTLRTDRGPDETLGDYVDRVSEASRPAGVLADETVLDTFPRGRGVDVSAEFPTDVGVWRWFTGAIHHRHVRDGVEWRRGQARCENAVRDQFLGDLDERLDNVPAPGRNMGKTFRQLYLARW